MTRRERLNEIIVAHDLSVIDVRCSVGFERPAQYVLIERHREDHEYAWLSYHSTMRAALRFEHATGGWEVDTLIDLDTGAQYAQQAVWVLVTEQDVPLAHPERTLTDALTFLADLDLPNHEWKLLASFVDSISRGSGVVPNPLGPLGPNDMVVASC